MVAALLVTVTSISGITFDPRSVAINSAAKKFDKLPSDAFHNAIAKMQLPCIDAGIVGLCTTFAPTNDANHLVNGFVYDMKRSTGVTLKTSRRLSNAVLVT